MNPHDIDEIDAQIETDTTSGRPRAAIAGESDDARKSGEKKEKKKAAPSKHRKARRVEQSEPQGKAEDDEDTRDGSHPRPDHARVEWLLWNEFAVSPEVAAAALNVSRNSGYAAIHNKDIPATRVGNRLMVPTAYLRQRLYLEPPPPEPTTPASPLHIAAHPKKQESIKSPMLRRRRR